MKKLIIIYLFFIPAILSGQQFPFMEAYFLNPYSLSSAQAGLQGKGTLFMDYRSDWTGIDGGPRTYQLTYNDRFRDKVGLGGKFIYDKTDIFKQTLILGTYTYEIKINEEHTVNLGLSLGVYRNSIDLTKYYNDPSYVQDLVLLYGDQQSKLKFASDFSALYRYKHLETGFFFSNMMFGTVHYKNSDMSYKPFKNYLLHASFQFIPDEKWSLKPMVILRGGQNVPAQVDIAAELKWNDMLWVTTVFRTPGIFGVGLGAEIYHGIILNYTYNLSNLTINVPVSSFASHQVTLGIRLKKLFAKQ